MNRKPASGTTVPRSLFTTANLPPERRFRAWQESIAVLYDISPDRHNPASGFVSTIDAFHLGSMAFGSAASGRQSFERSRLRVARDGIDHYLIQAYLEGRTGIAMGRTETVAGPGDIVILDSAEPLSSWTEDFHNLTLVVPRAMLAPRLAVDGGHHGRVVPGSDPLAILLRAHMRELFATAPALSPARAELLGRPTLELVAALMNGTAEGAAEAAGAVQSVTLARIRRHIDDNLRKPGLSADGILRDLGLSRARLYRIFEPLGGVATYIRKRRLRRCLKDLADPAQRHRRISDIAWDWGFADQASFSRAFRAEFGTTPREARGLKGDWFREHAGDADSEVGDRRYETWLLDLLKV